MSEQHSSHATTDPLQRDSLRQAGSLTDDEITHTPSPSSSAADDLAAHPSDSRIPADDPDSGSNVVDPSVPLPNHETVISNRPPIQSPLVQRPTNPMEMGAQLAGERLGHFVLDKFVGGGGMGAVFRAQDTMLDRIVAVKVLSRDQSDDEIVRRFKNEAQSAARLDHDNIARVYYVGEDKGWNYIVFEFIEGQNIRDLLSQIGPLPLEQAVNFTLQVAEALEHASHRDVVHRDIKPSNVLVTPDGQVKLVDMGLARLHQVETPNDDLTASGVTLGTFDYISPEQARDPRNADVRSDLYSLGCTLYFMLTGQPPFPDGTVLQKLLSHTSDERPDARLYRPDLPDEIIEILNRMLARNPKERFQQPSELIGELLLLADRLGLHGASQGGTVWITSAARQPNWAERLIPVLVPVVLLICAVWLLDRILPSGDSNAKFPHRKRDTAIIDNSIPSTETNQTNQGDQNKSEDTTTHNSETTNTADESTSGQPDLKTGTTDPKTNGTETDSSKEARTASPPNQLASLIDSVGTANLISATVSEGLLSAKFEAKDDTASLTLAGDPGHLSAADLSANNVEVAIDPLSIRQVIVGAIGANTPFDSLVVTSFEEAIITASDLPDVEKIELWFDGPMVVEPFQMSATELVVRAGDGYSPEIIFRSERDLANNGHMIRIVGGATTWEGIHFRFELPRVLSDGWSLFQLDQIVSHTMSDCTMTIVNADDDGNQRQHQVAFFQIPATAVEMMAGGGPAADPPLIELHRCIARGQATLVRLAKVKPLEVKWTQGLLVTTERLLRAGGAMKKPEWHGKVAVVMENVTAVTQQGLCLMDATSDLPHQLQLYVECNNSIVELSSNEAWIEHRGVQDEKSLKERMEFITKHSLFPDKSMVWRVVSQDESASPDPVLFDKNLMGENWFDQNMTGPITPTTWKQLPDDLGDAHRHTKINYQLSERHNNPEQRRFAGFDPALLPDLPPAKSSVTDDPLSTPSRQEVRDGKRQD